MPPETIWKYNNNTMHQLQPIQEPTPSVITNIQSTENKQCFFRPLNPNEQSTCKNQTAWQREGCEALPSEIRNFENSKFMKIPDHQRNREQWNKQFNVFIATISAKNNGDVWTTRQQILKFEIFDNTCHVSDGTTFGDKVKRNRQRPMTPPIESPNLLYTKLPPLLENVCFWCMKILKNNGPGPHWRWIPRIP